MHMHHAEVHVVIFILLACHLLIIVVLISLLVIVHVLVVRIMVMVVICMTYNKMCQGNTSAGWLNDHANA
jgi:hypothetical protein